MVVILNFAVGSVIILCKKWLATLQKSNTVISKGHKGGTRNVINDNGQKLPYVVLKLSISHLHIAHHNNINICHWAYMGYANPNINIFSKPSVHVIHIQTSSCEYLM